MSGHRVCQVCRSRFLCAPSRFAAHCFAADSSCPLFVTREATMKVLVAGLPKTGTKSMATALGLLGYEVYDVMENFWYLGEDWRQQIAEGFTLEHMRRMYENVDAVTDTPCDVYWEEIFDAFPNVKVILTTRDDQAWLASTKKQRAELSKNIPFRVARTITYTGAKLQSHLARSVNHLGRTKTWPLTGGFALPDETVLRVKKRHERNVKQVVPKEQLLVYNVKEGWEPLCKFLDLPIPDVPFPHKNRAGAVAEELKNENPVMQRIVLEMKISLLCLFVALACVVYKIFQFL